MVHLNSCYELKRLEMLFAGRVDTPISWCCIVLSTFWLLMVLEYLDQRLSLGSTSVATNEGKVKSAPDKSDT